MPKHFVKPPVSQNSINKNSADNTRTPIRARQLHQQLFSHAGTIHVWQPVPTLPGPDRANANNHRSLTGKRAKAAHFYRSSLDELRRGNIELALSLIAKACTAAQIPAEYYCLHADLLQRRGDLDKAVHVVRTWVGQYHKDANAWDILGELLAKRSEFNEAKHCYEKALELNPGLLRYVHNLATTLQHLGETKEAEAKYQYILKREPRHLDASLNLACLLNGAGRYQEALATVEDVLDRNSTLEKAFVIASAVEYNLERYTRALTRIDQAIAIGPDQVKLLTRRAEILSKMGSNNLAVAECDKVLARFPKDAEALRAKAGALRALNRPAEALAVLLFAESATSEPASLVVDRAWLLAEMGRKDEALRLLDKTISAQPDHVSALDCRSFLTRYKPEHPDVAVMERLVEKSEIPIKDRARLSLSIGKVYLGAGNGEKAFHHLNIGNALKRTTVRYDRTMEERWFSAVMETFSAEHMPYLPSNNASSARPIFVFGMPRSGTTLVEQILASHPVIRGTGETPHLDRLARSSVFLPGLSGLSAPNLASCADQYLQLVAADVPENIRFVDKTNSNFLYAGLISRMLPGARMIHCRRDPLDTCLSCYSLLFASGHEFSYDLSELGHYYSLYRQMMAHWVKVLPSERLLEIEYESLVIDTEAQIRKILDFCELPWDDACLRFYETDRLVITSSFDQIRSPIYKSSIGRAQIFRPWLGALMQSLQE